MWRPQNNKSGFSIVVAILVSAFLIVVSMGVLDLILGEQRITKVVNNTISSYAGAEGALELALLKIKNHRDGFSDEITLDGEYSGLLAANKDHPKRNEQKIAYEMNTREKSLIGSAQENEFVIVPLFFDAATVVEHSDTESMTKTSQLKVAVGNNVVWNILGNNTLGETEGLVGTGGLHETTDGDMRVSVGDEIKSSRTRVSQFLQDHADNYLVLFSDHEFTYKINANNGFTLPKMSVTASAQIGDFIQNINFSEDKSRLFDALKYSIFSEE